MGPTAGSCQSLQDVAINYVQAVKAMQPGGPYLIMVRPLTI